ncbi:MAG: tRNA (adenosine(37)-N6)-threonylcarbamoyltransferase complex dimerization subunit type 1 TsaB [Betaproteobacteria bacterium]|nr:tRNA (adenosine(37)-N6)-threonylcarbamoyltransferase complex dimerization subunit type 1 TsaB [Betaproteobacteria bacterium]
MHASLPVLAFDCSTEWVSVALDVGAARVVTRREPGGARASQRLLPLVQEVLAEAGIGLREVGLIGFGAGPGAFTGLRAACAAAQGLAFGLNRPVVPVHTLLAVAASAVTDAPLVLAADDARMGEIYWALASRTPAGEWRLQDDARADAPPALSQAWTEQLGDVPRAGLALCGNAWAAHGASLRAVLPEGWQDMLASALTVAPEAAAIAGLARAAHARGESVSAVQAQPIYVRNKVALTSEERMQAREAASRAAT